MIRALEEKDLMLLNEWVFEWRNLRFASQYYEADTDVKDGFICDDTAAGWLIEASRKLAFLDGFIASPFASKQQRDESLDALSQHLLAVCKERGVKRVYAITYVPAIINRALSLGFVVQTQQNTLLVKEL